MHSTGVRHAFNKTEVLRSKQQIKELFDHGSSFFLYPFKVFFAQTPATSIPAKVLISVPKKIFKKAVDRNLIKRRIRESYRCNKNMINDDLPGGTSLSLGLIYVGKLILPYEEINNKLKQALLRLINVEIHKKNNKHE
jgi:ribonuclease P protein component